MGDFWVFGYGSLMWRPGFAHVETRRARLHGFRRLLCVTSHIYRGTPERPGLVLGLDRTGVCEGMAFLVPPERIGATLTYLTDREQVLQAGRASHRYAVAGLNAEYPGKGGDQGSLRAAG